MKLHKRNKAALVRNSENRIGNTVLAMPSSHILWPVNSNHAEFLNMRGSRVVVIGLVLDPTTIETFWAPGNPTEHGTVFVHGIVTVNDEFVYVATVPVRSAEIVVEYRYIRPRPTTGASPFFELVRSQQRS